MNVFERFFKKEAHQAERLQQAIHVASDGRFVYQVPFVHVVDLRYDLRDDWNIIFIDRDFSKFFFNILWLFSLRLFY